MEDSPNLLPDVLTSFELFKVPLEKKVRVVTVAALEEVRVIDKVPLREPSVVGIGLLFLTNEAAVFLRAYRQHEVKGGGKRRAYKKRFCKSRSISSSRSLSNRSASMSSSLVKEGGAKFGTYRAGVFLLHNK